MALKKCRLYNFCQILYNFHIWFCFLNSKKIEAVYLKKNDAVISNQSFFRSIGIIEEYYIIIWGT